MEWIKRVRADRQRCLKLVGVDLEAVDCRLYAT